MAVQQNRKTPSKRDMRRSHDALGFATVSKNKENNDKLHLRHHVDADGFYRGKQMVVPKGKKTAADEE